MPDRAFFRWICVIAGLILALAWLLSATVAGFAAPSWVAPSAVVALAVAMVLGTRAGT